MAWLQNNFFVKTFGFNEVQGDYEKTRAMLFAKATFGPPPDSSAAANMPSTLPVPPERCTFRGLQDNDDEVNCSINIIQFVTHST